MGWSGDPVSVTRQPQSIANGVPMCINTAAAEKGERGEGKCESGRSKKRVVEFERGGRRGGCEGNEAWMI